MMRLARISSKSVESGRRWMAVDGGVPIILNASIRLRRFRVPTGSAHLSPGFGGWLLPLGNLSLNALMLGGEGRETNGRTLRGIDRPKRHGRESEGHGPQHRSEVTI